MAQPISPNASSASLMFPEDIGNLGFYMTFLFSKYTRSSVFGNANPLSASSGGIALPMPNLINDQPLVLWESTSMTDQMKDLATKSLQAIPGADKVINNFGSSALGAAGAATGLASTYLQATYGMTLNPFLIMLFKSPQYKEFTFSWTLTPRTASESDTLNDIVKQFRMNMLPDVSNSYANVLMDYPYIVKPAFQPKKYMFDFKWCAIKDMSIDYTGLGMPAFTTTDAPAAIKLTIHLTEIDLWMRSDLLGK